MVLLETSVNGWCMVFGCGWSLAAGATGQRVCHICSASLVDTLVGHVLEVRVRAGQTVASGERACVP